LALHPVDPAAPFVIVQLMPGTLDVTCPLPAAPDATVSAWLSAGGEKVTAMVREKSIVTSHASGFSEPAVHPDHATRVPVTLGAAVSVRTVPGL
jgi:hypothetical protein